MGYLNCAANRDICLAGLKNEEQPVQGQFVKGRDLDSQQKCDKLDFYAEYNSNGFLASDNCLYFYKVSMCL
jgi:hypothetical protein